MVNGKSWNKGIMMSDSYFVQVIQYRDFEIEKQLGPMSLAKAEKVDDGININLNHDNFFTKIVRKGDNDE